MSDTSSGNTPFEWLCSNWSHDPEDGHSVEDCALWRFVLWALEEDRTMSEVKQEATRFAAWDDANYKRAKWYA